jgi:uncharacterized HhH-GPD family protein
MTELDWSRLTRHLARQTRDRVQMSFADIEHVLGAPLPPAATGRGYWTNGRDARTDAWRSVDFRVIRRGLPAGTVAFVRQAPRPVPAAAPASETPPRPFTSDPDAARLVRHDPFAFLLGALLDHGIPPDRAWRAPLVLQQRLGHLDPQRMVTEPEAVQQAVGQPPVLHRYKHTAAAWVVAAAQRVLDHYGGEAVAVWSDAPTRAELLERLVAFDGIGEVKARKAIEHLQLDLRVEVRDEARGDVA